MEILVIYRSFLGTTKHYATWLKEELDADVIEFRKVNERILTDYDVIIVTSGTYAGKMPLVGFLKKYWPLLKSKKVIVMAVGIAPAEDKQSKMSYELIPQEIRSKIRYFKVPGSLFGIKPAGEPSKDKLAPVVSYVNEL